MSVPALVTYRDLGSTGLSRHQLERLVSSGDLERVAPGVFVRTGFTDDTTAGWTAAATKKPSATLCLMTALALHDLTDEIPRRSDVALPRGVMAPAVENAPIRWHSFDRESFTIGREDHVLPTGVTIGLYSPERTLVDIFRLRHHWGEDLALDSLKHWLKRPGSSPAKLLGMAVAFPKARPALQNALEVLL